jgi:1,4-alpha-glucan branching enzyme
MIRATAERAAKKAGITTRLGEQDVYLFREGTHDALYAVMGCVLGEGGATFRLWAPNAARVSVIGEWNAWNPDTNPLVARGDHTGIWEGAAPGVARGHAYKYRIVTRDGGTLDKADPFALYAEPPPLTASRAWTLDYEWADEAWMASRRRHNALDAPMSIYELHVGSWRREDSARLPGYRDIARQLADYVADQGFTHVELLPITEHPFYGSWG